MSSKMSSSSTAAAVAAAAAAAAAAAPHLCLRWNNYQSNLTSVFDQLLQNETFVDVTLAADGHAIKAHRMVLSACSPYFQALFFDNPCQHPIVILKDTRWSELKAIVEYMYRGEISVAQVSSLHFYPHSSFPAPRSPPSSLPPASWPLATGHLPRAGRALAAGRSPFGLGRSSVNRWVELTVPAVGAVTSLGRRRYIGRMNSIVTAMQALLLLFFFFFFGKI